MPIATNAQMCDNAEVAILPANSGGWVALESVPTGAPYSIPSRAKMSARKSRHCSRIIGLLATGPRVPDFTTAFENLCSGHCCGHYRPEAEAVWNIIKAYRPKSIAEIGRDYGGHLYMMINAAEHAETFFSIDLRSFEAGEKKLSRWLMTLGVRPEIIVGDSTRHAPSQIYDLVYIDGDHSGEGVGADIANWKNHARLIGFHDFADQGRANRHRRVFPELVEVVAKAKAENEWIIAGTRGRSDIIFMTKLHPHHPCYRDLA